MNTTGTPAPKPMYDHLFLAGSRVNNREHNRQWRAFMAGARTLSEWHAYRRANYGTK